MTDSPYRYMAGDTPAERAAALMTSPAAVYALHRALKHGQVTGLDMEREFVAAIPGRLAVLLRQLAASGYLVTWKRDDLRQATPLYTPGDLGDLHALHAELGTLLALDPEVRNETHK